jgi:acyl carrier protein
MHVDTANVRETIVECLREEKPSFADKFQDSTLCSEIEIDSIDIIQIVFRLEDIFKISIDIDPSSRFETIGQLLDFLQNMVVESRRNDATAS